MWNTPTKEELAEMPRLYETENIPLKDKIIHMHFSIGSCDWYIAENDGDDLFWGFVILDDDFVNAEWGYVSFKELKGIKIDGWLEIDRDVNWKVRKASEVERIKTCYF